MLTIQPSVFIWTLICFCLLMLILHRLLFRPMLSFMDARRARIDRAAARQEENRRLRTEAQAAVEARLQENAGLTAQAEQEQLSRAGEEAACLVEQARQRGEQRLQECRAGSVEERRQFDARLEQGLEELAQAFVHKFVS